MKLVIGSINWAQGNRIMSSFYHFETSARTGHRLSSFSDGSDCPTIGPDGECCRCIGQALTRAAVKGGPRKRNSFRYFFYQGEVCKRFYLSVLNISDCHISCYHEHNVSASLGTPIQGKHGNHTKKRISEMECQAVRDHINSFPRIAVHLKVLQGAT